MILNEEQEMQVVDYYKAFKDWWDDDLHNDDVPSYFGKGKHLLSIDRANRREIADTIELAVKHKKSLDKAFALLYTMGYEVTGDE